jgi:chromosome segregation ATPase
MTNFKRFLIQIPYIKVMANDDITNQQLLDTLTTRFDKRFDGLEDRLGGVEQRLGGLEQRSGDLEQRLGRLEHRSGNLEQQLGDLANRFGVFENRFSIFESRFDKLDEMVTAINDTLANRVINTMATSQELTGLKEELHEDFDNLELRVGRRIDASFAGKTAS